MRAFAILVLLLLAFATPAAAHGDVSRFAFEQHPGAKLPQTLAFADDRGRAISLGDYLGRAPIVLVLGYFDCPNLCDTAFAGVLESLRTSRLEPGRDYHGLFVSINPRENPARAAAKKREQLGSESAEAWSFLTGPASASSALAQAVGFPFEYDAKEREYVHPAGFIVVSPSGTISRYFPGVRFDARELRTALRDAARGRVGTLADRLLLLCAHFEPATGRYGTLIWNATRALVLLFALGFAALLWRQRQRR